MLGQDDQAGEVDARAGAELAEDRSQVEVDRVRGDEQALGGLAVREAFGDDVGDAALGVGEARPPVRRAAPSGA
jgi:hypothetical protein